MTFDKERLTREIMQSRPCHEILDDKYRNHLRFRRCHSQALGYSVTNMRSNVLGAYRLCSIRHLLAIQPSTHTIWFLRLDNTPVGCPNRSRRDCHVARIQPSGRRHSDVPRRRIQCCALRWWSHSSSMGSCHGVVWCDGRRRNGIVQR